MGYGRVRRGVSSDHGEARECGCARARARVCLACVCVALRACILTRTLRTNYNEMSVLATGGEGDV